MRILIAFLPTVIVLAPNHVVLPNSQPSRWWAESSLNRLLIKANVLTYLGRRLPWNGCNTKRKILGKLLVAILHRLKFASRNIILKCCPDGRIPGLNKEWKGPDYIMGLCSKMPLAKSFLTDPKPVALPWCSDKFPLEAYLSQPRFPNLCWHRHSAWHQTALALFIRPQVTHRKGYRCCHWLSCRPCVSLQKVRLKPFFANWTISDCNIPIGWKLPAFLLLLIP